MSAYSTAERLESLLLEGEAAVEAEQGRDSVFVNVCPEPECAGRVIAEGGCRRCIAEGCGWTECG